MDFDDDGQSRAAVSQLDGGGLAAIGQLDDTVGPVGDGRELG
ncbi:hypothetical protein [Nocardiopsis rhodophaea]